MTKFIQLTLNKDDADEHYNEKRVASYKSTEGAVDQLEAYLKRAGTDFITGNDVTIADIHIFHEATSEFMINGPHVAEDEEKRPLLTAWRKRMIAIPAIGAVNEQFEAHALPWANNWLKIE